MLYQNVEKIGSQRDLISVLTDDDVHRFLDCIFQFSNLVPSVCSMRLETGKGRENDFRHCGALRDSTPLELPPAARRDHIRLRSP